MRQRPIGTGPFKFVEFKPNERIVLARNPDYWKQGRPYLDGIEYTIIRNASTWILALGAKKFDRTGPGFIAPALLKEIKGAAPEMECRIDSWNTSRSLITNRNAPPFDNPELRKAIALALDRKEFINIIGEGHGDIGPTMQPAPEGVWGMPPEMVQTLFSYGPDIAKNRAEAREIMQKLGYGPDKRLAVTVTTRNVAAYRDPAIILISQLKEIYIDGTLNAIDTTQWYPTVMRKDYTRRLHRHRNRPRRSRPDVLRKLLLRLGTQLHRLLRPRDRQIDRPAIRHDRFRQAPRACLGDRAAVGGRRGPADHLSPAPGDLRLHAGQGHRYRGQQPV